MMYYRSLLILVLALEIFGIFVFASGNGVQENEHYIRLKKYLDAYTEIKNKGGWQSIKEGKVLHLGMKDPRVAELKKRLSVTNELLQLPGIVSDTFDLELETAVKTFQKNHGIPVTGIADAKTIHELNYPVSKRIRQIELNLKRWKTYPAKFETCYVFVNIASGQLDMIVNDSSVLAMKVIVGRLYRKTPVFSADLHSIEINPYWIIPPGILKKDVLPKLKTNASYLKKNNMEVFYNDKRIDPSTVNWNKTDPAHCPYKIIQNPGPANPMGLVKFSFPNKYYVYMHDTPAKELFDASSLTFSSGCIRLSKATELATCILKQDGEWTGGKTDSLIATGKNDRIYLKTPIKVYIGYFTAWVNQAGDLQFAPDIYKRDN